MTDRVKHLEMLLTVISRMASQSANLKSFSMAIIAGGLGLSSSLTQPILLFYFLPLVAVFAGLDAQYLNLERGFRRKYNEVRNDGGTVTYAITPIQCGPLSWLLAFFSWSVLGFYIVLAIVLLGVIAIM